MMTAMSINDPATPGLGFTNESLHIKNTFMQSAKDDLLNFANAVNVKKWAIASDYVIGGSGAYTDSFAFTIYPYIKDFALWCQEIHAVEPLDIKDRMCFRVPWMQYMRDCSVFHIVFLLDKGFFYGSSPSEDKAMLLKMVESLRQLLALWEANEKNEPKKSSYKRWITGVDNKIISLKATMRPGKYTQTRNVFTVAMLYSMIEYFLLSQCNAELVGWMGDRDPMLQWLGGGYEGFVLDLTGYYTHILMANDGLKENGHKLARIVPRFDATQWYDDINRMPDYLAGGFSRFRMGSIGQDVEIHPFLEQFCVDNPMLAVIGGAKSNNGFSAKRYMFSAKPK